MARRWTGRCSFKPADITLGHSTGATIRTRAWTRGMAPSGQCNYMLRFLPLTLMINARLTRPVRVGELGWPRSANEPGENLRNPNSLLKKRLVAALCERRRVYSCGNPAVT